MTLTVHAVRARTPWGAGTYIPDEAEKETAPRRDEAYRCARGCAFTVPLAAEAEAPSTWDCRCGGTARLEGAPEGTGGKPAYPGYGSIGVPKGTSRPDVSPMAQLRKRRTRKQGDAILAEALERARQTGEAR